MLGAACGLLMTPASPMWKQFIKWFAGKPLEDPSASDPDDVLEGLVYGRDSSVPMDPRLMRHDGWGPVRRRRPGEEIESA